MKKSPRNFQEYITGINLSVEHHHVVPDIIVVGKAFASGYVPISASIVRREIAQKNDK